MLRFFNTDNGRTIDVLEAEAFIYERASNFELVGVDIAEDDKSKAKPSTIPASETSFDDPVKRSGKPVKTAKKKT